MLAINQQNQVYEQLISQMIESERAPQRRIEQQRSEVKTFQGVLKDFDTELSSLNSELQTLTDSFSNPFEALRANVSDDVTAFDVSVDSDAAPGTHTIEVQQLAKLDTRVSQQYDADATSLRDFFDANGAQTFSVEVAHPTDGNPDNREAISVTVDPTGTTNEEILQEVSAAIDTAMADAVDAGTITSDEKAAASMVNETSNTARLSLRSGQTGFANRLTFTDSADGLLGELQVTQNDTTIDDGSGGQVYNVGTDETDSALSSQFTLDGLTLYRNSNTVDDALDGTTLELNAVDTTERTFTIETDDESVEEVATSFIEQYNNLLSYIDDKSEIDPESDTRGPFAGESAFRRLRFNLRNDANATVASQPDGAPDRLSDIGITMNDDGTLELSDTEALTKAVEDNSDAVKSLFASDDGIATQMLDRVNRYVKSGGIMDQREQSAQSRIRRLDDRIERFDRRLERREDQLREQFSQLQEMQQRMQSEQQYINSFFG